MSWFVTEANLAEMQEKTTILLYGDTGDGKTTLLGEYAEWKFKKTGLRTRLYTADPGGWRGVKPHVAAGIIEVVNLVDMPRPWEWVAEVTRGKVPTGVNPDGSPAWVLDLAANAKVGVYAFEGFTAFCEGLLQHAAIEAAEGRTIGAQAPNFRYSQGNVRWAGNSPSNFGDIQKVITIACLESFHLNGDVIWTAMARRAGDADTTAPILGPQIVGKALTSDVPRWFVYTFRLSTVPGNATLGTKSEHRLHIEDHAELTVGINPIDGKPATNIQKALGNSRLPLDADEVKPMVVPASVVGAIAMIEQGGSQALAKIRARVAAARPNVA